MGISAAIYDIEADLATWWTEEYVIKEREGAGPLEPVDLTGKTVQFLVGGKVLVETTEGKEGLEVKHSEGRIIVRAYVVPSMRGEYRLQIHNTGETEPFKAEPFVPIWGSFTPLGPPQ